MAWLIYLVPVAGLIMAGVLFANLIVPAIQKAVGA